jgi:protein tyrosine/serine phosphatase
MGTSDRRSVLGIKNFSQVTPLLYRGAQPNEHGFQQLKCLGVQIVVNLRYASEAARIGEESAVTKLGIEYVSIPSNCRKPHDENVARFLSLVREHPDKKIFVHCEFGIDRTGLMIAAYRMAEDGWTRKEAFAEMRSNGFNWMHQIAWCPETYHYEQHFAEKLKTDSALQKLAPARQSTGP